PSSSVGSGVIAPGSFGDPGGGLSSLVPLSLTGLSAPDLDSISATLALIESQFEDNVNQNKKNKKIGELTAAALGPSSLQSQVAGAKADLATKQQELVQAQQNVTNDQNAINQLNSENPPPKNYQTQLDTLNAQLTADQATVTNLQNGIKADN